MHALYYYISLCSIKERDLIYSDAMLSYFVDLIDPLPRNPFQEMHVCCATITHCSLHTTLIVASNKQDCAIVLPDTSTIPDCLATVIMFSFIK